MKTKNLYGSKTFHKAPLEYRGLLVSEIFLYFNGGRKKYILA